MTLSLKQIADEYENDLDMFADIEPKEKRVAVRKYSKSGNPDRKKFFPDPGDIGTIKFDLT